MDRIATYIDHTLVKPETTQTQIARLCEEAVEHRFAAVAVNQVHARFASSLLRGRGIAVAVAVAFPLGVTSTQVKSYEAERALDDGASELDVMINLGALKGGQYALVEEDIAAITRICHGAGAICKAILETGLLTDDEKVRACQLAAAAGADFVKTSTGFGPCGATVGDVSLMRRTVGPAMGVKAAGGIRNYQEAMALIQAGANRLGVSAAASLEIVLREKELQGQA
jgi:deoxyribose-phosphate aldolase